MFHLLHVEVIRSAGCSIGSGSHLCPRQGLAVGSFEHKDPSAVSLIKQGVKPPKSCVRLAQLSAKGDPYTTRETLENSLKFERAKVGADFVLVTGHKEIEDNNTPHFVEYGAGIPIADDVKNP